MALTAAEQYLIELINRSRLDPLAEAARYGLALNAGLSGNVISGEALAPVSPNTLLEDAAFGHSTWMLQADTFDHNGAGGDSPGARISKAGYEFLGAWAWRENLAWTGTTGNLDLTAAVEEHHEGLYRSAGHRVNTFSENVREIGVAQVAGAFTHQGTTYNSSMLTINYAQSGSDVYITGVAYTDRDGDAFYGVGEGTGDIWIRADGASVRTADAGGYGLGVGATNSLTVQVGEGSTTLAVLRVDASDGNVKVDVVTQTDGSKYLAVSSSATLVSGITDARLLGSADLDLNGNAEANRLIGNAGNNELRGFGGADDLLGGRGDDALFGGNGNDLLRGGTGRDASWSDLDTSGASGNSDRLLGEAGNDILIGESGYDVLNGGLGDDMLTGGGGRDTFVFTAGRDTITDFADNVDTIEINTMTLGLDLAIDDVIAMGRITGGDAVFDFGNGNVLTLEGETDLSLLINDLTIL